MPKPRRAKSKSKPARKDRNQLELDALRGDGRQAKGALKVEAAATAEDMGFHRTPGDRLWNRLAGLSLFPFVCVFTIALYRIFLLALQKTRAMPFWRSAEFGWFALGAGLWLAWTCVCLRIWRQPRPVRMYVFGHELTHGVMARAFGGRIKAFHVTAEGGHIVTDKYNSLIALAPYLWPFWSVPVLLAWGITYFWKGPAFLQPWFLAAFGFTWMFHLTFTLWVLMQGQSDVSGPGRIFSFLLIYLANVILISGALIVFARRVGWHAYRDELWAATKTFYSCAAGVVAWCWDAIARLAHGSP